MTTKLKLSEITLDPTLLVREPDPATVKEYTDALKEGAEFPPLDVWQQSVNVYILLNGLHRLRAHEAAGIESVSVNVYTFETRTEALRWAIWCDAHVGLRRSNEARRRSVELALADPELSQLSDRELATLVGVSHTLVYRIRHPEKDPKQAPKPAVSKFDTQPVTPKDNIVENPYLPPTRPVEPPTIPKPQEVTPKAETAPAVNVVPSSTAPTQEQVLSTFKAHVASLGSSGAVLEFLDVIEDHIVAVRKDHRSNVIDPTVLPNLPSSTPKSSNGHVDEDELADLLGDLV